MKNLKALQLALFISLFFTSTFSNALADIVDTNASVIKWIGKKVTGKHYGKVSLKSGDLEIKDGKIVGGSFVADMTTITVDDLTGKWQQKFLGHMKSDDFFSTAKFQTAKILIKKVDGNKIMADLTIKGKTNPVTFNYNLKGKTFSGDFNFDRTKYDIKYNSGKFFESLGDKLIYDDVEMSFNVVLK